MIPREVEPLQKRAVEQCFQSLLPLRDTLSLVVTGHLFAEYWLDWLIRASIPKPEKLLDSGRLSFTQKVAVAESMNLLRGTVSEALRGLNSIRNRFAHDFEYKITQDDLRKLKTVAPPIDRKKKKMLNELGSPKKELFFFCMFFAGYAVGIVSGRKNAKSKKRPSTST